MSSADDRDGASVFILGLRVFLYFLFLFSPLILIPCGLKLKRLIFRMIRLLRCCTPTTTEPENDEDTETEVRPVENVASWGDTFSHISEFNYVWTIHNFSHHPRTCGEYLDSPPFQDSEGRTKWNLRLYPGGRGAEHKEHVSLHLCLLNSNILRDGFAISKEVNAKLKVSILDESKKSMWDIAFTGTRGFQPKNAGTNWGWHKFMSHDLLFDSNKGYLHDDKLIIMSEVSMLASVTASTGVIPAPPSTLAEDLAAIQYDSSFSDVTLKTKGRSFKAHRVILAARSPVFRAMFTHNMQEAKNNEVIIKDIDAEVMEELLRFVYTNKVQDITRIAKALLAAADKYALDSLKVVCESTLIGQMTVEDVASILVLSDLHRCNHLKDAALAMIKRFPDKLVKTAGWNEMVLGYPSLVAEIITSQQRGSTSSLALADSGIEVNI